MSRLRYDEGHRVGRLPEGETCIECAWPNPYCPKCPSELVDDGGDCDRCGGTFPELELERRPRAEPVEFAWEGGEAWWHCPRCGRQNDASRRPD